MSTSLQRRGSNLPHPKKSFLQDHAYIRSVLRQAEAAIAAGDWQDAKDAYLELSGVCGNLEAFAFDNHHRIRDAYTLDAEQIAERKAAR